MESGNLFNPGFLGGNFLWWVGQIADDSTWRDNIIPGKFQDPKTIPGWGYRYKVRIIGLHDQGEEVIPSNQLPWAQVMFPITAGGGQTASLQTPSLRQGMMVFGFFLDSQDQQVPVIMGVLGNNAQTDLSPTIGDNRVTNQTPGSLATSGFAQGQNPLTGTAKPKVPDSNLSTIQQKVPTQEGVNAVHLLSAADTKRNDLYIKKRILLEPNNIVSSALKAIQTALETLTREIDKILQAAQSYIDAVSSVLRDIQSIISNAACEIAKYMKVIFDKIFEYVQKKINSAISPTIDLLFPNDRYKFIDIKEEINDIITCLYSKITNNLCDLIESALNDLLDTTESSGNDKAPKVPICSVEKLTASVIATNLPDMQKNIDDILQIVNTFLDDILEELADVSGLLDSIGGISKASGLIGNINGNITEALDFKNITLNVLGCDLKPNISVSDFYTLQSGGGAAEESQSPNYTTITQSIENAKSITSENKIDFATPGKDTPNINYRTSDSRTPEQIAASTSGLA